jgi:predicted RNA-binding protein Jag
MDSLEKWSLFIAYADKAERKELITELAESKEEIKMAIALLETISKNEDERARYLSRLIARMDYESDIYSAREEGQTIGENKKEKELIINMLSANADDAFIIGVAGITPEKLEEYKAAIESAMLDTSPEE